MPHEIPSAPFPRLHRLRRTAGCFSACARGFWIDGLVLHPDGGQLASVAILRGSHPDGFRGVLLTIGAMTWVLHLHSKRAREAQEKPEIEKVNLIKTVRSSEGTSPHSP